MAGIYFHIPFCKKKCHYCDFYSKKDSKGINDLVKYEIHELTLRKDYLNKDIIETIYFGGGTPSLLNDTQIINLLECVKNNFEVSVDCEITFESNPDDLTNEYLKALYECGINRLSIGIQSFNDGILKFLGRRHDSKKLCGIIEMAKNNGFSNISVDLIFGIPGMNFESYLDSLNMVLKLDIQHISAYSLTIAEGTLFYKWLNNNTIQEIKEEELLIQFNSTIDILSEHGFLHYETSNYAKEGYKSRHNSAYWEDKKYLGIGPSAHSYNHISRQWNVSDTRAYCDHILNATQFYEIEYLTTKDKFNEYIITGLRTSNGVSENYIKRNFEEKFYLSFIKQVNKLLEDNLICFTDDRVTLNRKGIMISDYIMRLLYCL